MTDGPYPFSGKIVEAYYTNPELDTVSIIWSDGKKVREYYVVVDEKDHQFQALLKEFDYNSLDECTRKKHEAHREEFRKAFNNYASRNSSRLEEQQSNFNLLFDFDPEDNNHKEQLFKLKLKMFEQDVVKNSKARTKKTALRTAKTPFAVIAAYYSFLK